MRRIKHILAITTSAVLLGSSLVLSTHVPAVADTANAPSLIISQLKITSSNGQFVGLYNTTNITLDMSKYQLEYFNHYDLNKATSSKLISLTGSVPPHSYYLVNDSALQLCYQMLVDSTSLGLSSTSGFVQVLAHKQVNPGGPVFTELQDYVGWSKTAVVGAQTLPVNTAGSLLRQPLATDNNPSVVTPGSGSWLPVQPASTNSCSLVTISNDSQPVQIGSLLLLPSIEPSAVIESLSSGGTAVSDMPTIPLADIGLMAPQITEILPNPVGTGNDSTDEFIELYNPNTVSFDLTGFGLQTGLTALHNFMFPKGASLPAKSFVAFYAPDTKLSMSNTASQVKFLDPFMNSISSTAAYTKAGDGNAWALAKGKWYWTTTPTPAKANKINEPLITASKKKSTNTSSKSKTTNSVKKTLAGTNLASKAGSDVASVSPIHPLTLALVAALALLYGAYEYRKDIANNFFRIRRNITSRRANRT